MPHRFGTRAVLGTLLVASLFALNLGCAQDSPGTSPLQPVAKDAAVQPGKDLAPICDAGEPQETLSGETVILDGSGSFSPNGKIVRWRWDVGGERELEGPVVETQFEAGGKHIVTLCVTDETGLESCCKTIVYVRKPPVLLCDSGGPYSVRVNEPFMLDASGSKGPIEEWHWSLGDGRFAQGKTVKAVYPRAGKYEVMLCIVGPGNNGKCCLTQVEVIGEDSSKPAGTRRD